MKAEIALLIVLLLGMVATCFAQVIFRLVLGHPLAWSEELARYLFVWLTFIGGSVAIAESAHFKMDLLAFAFKERGKAILQLIVSICLLSFSIVLIIYGLPLVKMVSSQKSPALRISMSIPYFALPINGFLSSFHCVENIIDDIKRLKAK